MTRLRPVNAVPLDDAVDAQTLQELKARYRAGRPLRYVIQPLLMAIMITSLLFGLLSVIVAVIGDPRWFALTPLMFFISLEGIYTTNWLYHPRQMALERTKYRAAELLLLLIITRIAVWVIFDQGLPDAATLWQYVRAPQDLFLYVPFLITLILAAICWVLSVTLSGIFKRLEVTEFELRYYSLPLTRRKARADDQPIQSSRKELLDSYMNLWLWGGILLVFAAGLSTLEQQSLDRLLAPLASGRASLEPGLLSALLFYFIIGLWLMSQARLMHVNARWLVNSVATDASARRGWQLASLILLLLVVLVAAFVPIGSSFTLSRIVDLILYWLMFLASSVVFLLTLPFAWLLSLFSPGETQSLEPVQPAEPPDMAPPELPPAGSGLTETLSMVVSSGFWAVFLVLAVLALLFFLRERKPSASGGLAGAWESMLRWLSELWTSLRGGAQSMQHALRLLLEGEERPPADTPLQQRWRFIRVQGLSPRDQIRYFYLSALRRAGEQGVKRPADDTPLEFLQTLQDKWPEAREALDELTDAFLEARYSSQTIEEQDIPPAKASWKAVRRKLRRGPSRSSGGDGEAPPA